MKNSNVKKCEVKLTTDKQEAWRVKFQFLITRLKDLIAQEGKQMALVNVEADPDSNEQYDRYMHTVEIVRDKVECVVSTSLPGEERIFWPFYDVQFYIRDNKEAIGSTGDPTIIQRVFSTGTQELNTFLPDIGYWNSSDFTYQLDTTDYVDEQKLSKGEISLDSKTIIEKFGYRRAKQFENEVWWYILKFFFHASEFNNLDGFGQLIGGVPKELNVKCDCERLLDVELSLKGIFRVPEQDFEHQYYLYISRECESCGKVVCIYRPRGPLCPHLLVFMSHLLPDRKFSMKDIEMVSLWQDVFKRGAIKNMAKFERAYSNDIIKFGEYMFKMDKKHNK